jgi:streptogramin lyase
VSRASAIAAALVALAVSCAPAHASDVVRVKLGSSLQDLVVGTDGGAWVQIYGPKGVVVGRALPGGGFRTSGTGFGSTASAVGPDGQAWFRTGPGEYARSDAAGATTRVEIPRGPTLGKAMATGPDGTLWNLTLTGGRFAHVTPQGTVTYTATHVPKCEDDNQPLTIATERATDGAMWIIDHGCERLLRVTATATSVVALGVDVIAPDAAGGVWFAASFPSQEVGHVDTAGTVRRFELPDSMLARDVAAAPDGSAWFALGECVLARVSPAGEVTTVPAPLPAEEVGFDPAGGLWLASTTRLVHLAPGEPPGPCDSTAPFVRITGESSGRVSLKALRRGLRISVREPAVIEVAGYAYANDEEANPLRGTHDVERVLAHAGSFRYRLPAAVLRKLAAGRSPMLELVISARDAEGVESGTQSRLRITR